MSPSMKTIVLPNKLNLNVVVRYQYQYAVTDDYSKSNFQAEEERDGFSTLGSYR